MSSLQNNGDGIKAEKKNKFQISREAQEGYVKELSEAMLGLADKVTKGEKVSDVPMGQPFCPATGREYSGQNMVKLMLAGIKAGYKDDRWMSFKQIEQYQDEHPALTLKVRKGEKGVKVLRPEEIVFTVKADGKWDYLTPEREKEIRESGQGAAIQRMTLFYPYTVFNVEQIEGFPAKEKASPRTHPDDRDRLLQDFIRFSGLGHDIKTSSLSGTLEERERGVVHAARLREFFLSTGKEVCENRLSRETTLRNYAFEEMRAEIFSMLAGARYGLPMPTDTAKHLDHWNQQFTGGDMKAVFQAAADATKMFNFLRQYECGEQPRAAWFPKLREDDKFDPHLAEKLGIRPRPDESRPAEGKATALGQAEGHKIDSNFAAALEVLKNPQMLDRALQMDPASTRNLADLLGSLSNAMHMELDHRQNFEMPPTASMAEASASRMRM